MKLGILGAGGFVGTALCERLFFERDHEFVPIIHSFSGAARLARLPIEFRAADVLDERQVQAATAGCDALINCSRGDGTVMDQGLRNVIKAARANRIERLIHISSIAIYGSNPPPESANESAAPSPDDPYGFWKTGQDELLMREHRDGLGVILLCPANIYGPYSPFILGVAHHLRRGAIALVDGGVYPTNNVHVHNIVEAILVALRSNAGWGERYFVNEPERITWKQFFADMNAALGIDGEMETISREELPRAVTSNAPRPGVVDNLKTVASGDFRRALSVVPFFANVNGRLYRQFNRLDPRIQKWARDKMSRPTFIPKDVAEDRYANRFVLQQGKPVYHAPDKIMQTLGFVPFTYRQGMRTVTDWLQEAFS